MKRKQCNHIVDEAMKKSYYTHFLSKDEVSMFSYIDNVLAHHFDTFQEDIKKLYEQNNNIF